MGGGARRRRRGDHSGRLHWAGAGEPDVALVEMLASHVAIPVFAEGRYRTALQVRAALQGGAFAVVVGRAITDPLALTRAFVAATKSS